MARAPPPTRSSSATHAISTRPRRRKHHRPMSYKNTDIRTPPFGTIRRFDTEVYPHDKGLLTRRAARDAAGRPRTSASLPPVTSWPIDWHRLEGGRVSDHAT